MNDNFSYILTERGVVVYMDSRTHSISKTNAFIHDAIVEAIKDNDHDAIRELIDTKQRIADKSNGRIQKNEFGDLTYDGDAIDPSLSSRILNMIDGGFSVDPLLKFLDNLYQNVSYRAIHELYGFLSACDLPITNDGHFLAYKMVRADYRDIFSGTMDNSVGQTVTMLRYQVDDNRNQTCSAGLHVCSQGYLGHYGTGRGDKIVVCKVNPKDVVSVPVDYDNAKMRVCEYTVVDELFDDELIKSFYESRYDDSAFDGYDSDYDSDDDFDDDYDSDYDSDSDFDDDDDDDDDGWW